MQRINYFTNPNFTGPFANVHSYGGANAVYNDGTKQLNIYGDNGGYGFNLTVPKNAALVFACFLWTKHDKNPDPLRVYSLESSGNEPIASATISQDANNLLLRFNSTGSGRIRVEFYPNGNSVNIAKPILELADTYDKAVGGASGLLHWGHDAARIGASVGRVMSDDGHEPDKQSKRPRHAEAGRVHADYDHQEDSGYHILVHGLAGRVGRLRHDRQLSGHLQQEPTHRMALHVPDRESDEPEIQGRVRQSDRQGVEHGHVQAGRIPGEQSLARRPLLFRREYDAARLTLLGVVA
jgi:hypothetical protein